MKKEEAVELILRREEGTIDYHRACALLGLCESEMEMGLIVFYHQGEGELAPIKHKWIFYADGQLLNHYWTELGPRTPETFLDLGSTPI